VAAAAAAGVLMTVTGTVGGLCFAAWAGADKLWSVSRWGAVRRRALARAPRKPEVGLHAGSSHDVLTVPPWVSRKRRQSSGQPPPGSTSVPVARTQQPAPEL